MINAPYEREFVFHDGSRTKNILELVYKVESMSDGEFSSFVNSSKNDFANWIEHVFFNKHLANELRTTISKTTTLRLLKEEISEVSEKMTHGVTFGSSIVHSKHQTSHSTHEHSTSPQSNLHPVHQNAHIESQTHRVPSHVVANHVEHHVKEHHNKDHQNKEHEHHIEPHKEHHHVKEESLVKHISKDKNKKEDKKEIKYEVLQETKPEDKKIEKRSLFKSLLSRRSKEFKDKQSEDSDNIPDIKPIKKLNNTSSDDLSINSNNKPNNYSNNGSNNFSKSNKDSIKDDASITKEYISQVTNSKEKSAKKWFKLFSREDLSEKKLETLEHKEELKKKPEIELHDEIVSDGRENTLWVVLYISLVLLIITLLVYKLFLN